MASLRAALHRVAGSIALRTDPALWQKTVERGGVKLVRRRPMVFPDADALTDFLGDLHGDAVRVSVANQGIVWSGPPFDDAVAAITHAPPLDRSEIRVEGTQLRPDTGQAFSWSINFSSRHPRLGPQIWVGATEASDGWLMHLRDRVERFAREERGLKALAPLVEPISMEEGIRRDHDALVASRAARVGGWWGALGGALVGGLVTLIVELVTRAN